MIIESGENNEGLGRWSHVTYRGKKQIKFQSSHRINLVLLTKNKELPLLICNNWIF